jgi:hypothetical protein
MFSARRLIVAVRECDPLDAFCSQSIAPVLPERLMLPMMPLSAIRRYNCSLV